MIPERKISEVNCRWCSLTTRRQSLGHSTGGRNGTEPGDFADLRRKRLELGWIKIAGMCRVEVESALTFCRGVPWSLPLSFTMSTNDKTQP